MDKRMASVGSWFLMTAMMILVFAAWPAYAGAPKGLAADMVLLNGKILTVDKKFSIKQALAVKDGKFVIVGTNDQVKNFYGPGFGFIGPDTKVIDLKGKAVLPGFNDSHAHPAEQYVMQPPLTLALGSSNLTTIVDIQSAIATRVAQVQPDIWIHGDGWNPAQLQDCAGIENTCLNKGQLDAVAPNNPCAFTDFSGHNLWVNSSALDIAGITASTPDPQGGIIQRDGEGNPTGILTGLGATELVTKLVPPWTDEELRQAVLYGMQYSNKYGITSFTEGALGPGHETYAGGVMGNRVIKIYQDLFKEGRLTTRVQFLVSLMSVTCDTSLENLKKNLTTFTWPTTDDPQWLQAQGLKFFADGIPTDETSYMWDNYVDGGYGTLLIPGATDTQKEEELKQMVEYAHGKGFRVAIHATGDRAITTCVDGFERAMKKYPKNRDPRHYIIHGDFVRPQDAKRIAKIKAGVAMQPDIKALISDWELYTVGDERAAYEFPYRTAFDAGVPVAFNSDTITVTEPNVLHGIQSAVTRESFAGVVSGPEQAATRQEAIRAYTINGAWQDKMEKVKGSIERGKLADFVILDGDIMTAEAHTIGDIKVLMTVVGGKVVYDASVE
jgi:predicted amidohydrolase YtcJ